MGMILIPVFFILLLTSIATIISFCIMLKKNNIIKQLLFGLFLLILINMFIVNIFALYSDILFFLSDKNSYFISGISSFQEISFLISFIPTNIVIFFAIVFSVFNLKKNHLLKSSIIGGFFWVLLIISIYIAIFLHSLLQSLG